MCYYCIMINRPPFRAELVDDLQSEVLDWARTLSPGVSIDGLTGTQYLPIRVRRFGKFLAERLAVEQTITDQTREEVLDRVGWSFSKGLYSNYGIDRWDEEACIGTNEPTQKECTITNRIDELLKEPEAGKPVLAVDFGGGQGLSWIRIAALPKYRQAIKEGRLVLIVTNLGFKPEDSADPDGYTGIARSMNVDNALYAAGASVCPVSEEDMSWAEDSQKYVHYIDKNALELPDTTITLPDGSRLPLMGNVDIIHEQLALAHTHVPDLAIASLKKIMGRRGSFYSDAATSYHLMHPIVSETKQSRAGRNIETDEEYQYQRRIGLVVGSYGLRLSGLTYTTIPDLHLARFARSES